MKYRVVLYNPRAVFFTMPLALVALASRLDRRRYDVRIVDGRLEPDPPAAVLSALGDASACLAVSVLTGAPILDALTVTAIVRAARPDVPIVWGGWHPSLFPDETVLEARIEAAVVGQGEETFAEIVEHLEGGAPIAGIPGTVSRSGGEPTGVTRGPARDMRDVNAFPAHDFGLLPVDRYFALKGQRQLDYISSQGCRFRCTFCADPRVYQRAWFGLAPERVGEELHTLHRRHGMTDVNFQDETFFTSPTRVDAIAHELLSRHLPVTWAATMRADQGARLDETVLRRCRHSGLRRVMVGVESGSPETLDVIKKDATLEQVFITAEKCRQHGVAATFNLIVGFPNEPAESVRATLAVARRLRRMTPRFEIALFYFKPYPGTPIADALAIPQGGRPRTLKEWALFDYVGSPSPWLDPATRARVEAFTFYQRIGWSAPSRLRAPLQRLARWRCDHDNFAFPVEKALLQWWRPRAPLS